MVIPRDVRLARQTTARSGGNPLPVQFSPVREDTFKSDDGIAEFNQQMQMIVTELNRRNGNAGRVVIPNGVDVAGDTISNLGAPQNPTDAISSGHAEANYGAPTLSSKLDIGGSNTLKGLASLFLKFNQSQATATTFGEDYVEFSNGVIVQWGKTTTFDTGPETETFSTPFPNACLWVGLTGDWGTNSNARIWFASALTTTNFQAHNDGTQGAWWIAFGY